MLPQGIFSVAVATVLFPTMTPLRRPRRLRRPARHQRQRRPPDRAAADPRRVLHRGARRAADPARLRARASSAPPRPTRSREALFWFSFSLPFSGANLLLTRTFFSLQRPWFPTALAGMSLLVNAGVSLGALLAARHRRHRHRHAAVSSAAMTVAQAYFLRRELHGFEIGRTLRAVAGMLVGGRAARRSSPTGSGTCSTTRSASSLLAQFWSRSSSRWCWAAPSTPRSCSHSGSPRRNQIIGLIRGRMGRGAS